MEKRTWLYNLRWAFFAGLTGAILAYVLTRFTFQLIGENPAPETVLFLVLVPVTAFLTGQFSWLLVCQFSRPQTVAKGALNGVFIGWIAQPLLGAFWVVYANIFPHDAYLFMPEHASAMLLRSLLYSAWLTIPLGGLMGGVLAYLQTRSSNRKKESASEDLPPTPINALPPQ